MTLAERWGGAVAERRREVGLSQAALAERIGVTQQTISQIERGHTRPSDDLKLALAGGLEIHPAELFVWPEVA